MSSFPKNVDEGAPEKFESIRYSQQGSEPDDLKRCSHFFQKSRNDARPQKGERKPLSKIDEGNPDWCF